jgi:hypothetical protein
MVMTIAVRISESLRGKDSLPNPIPDLITALMLNETEPAVITTQGQIVNFLNRKKDDDDAKDSLIRAKITAKVVEVTILSKPGYAHFFVQALEKFWGPPTSFSDYRTPKPPPSYLQGCLRGSLEAAVQLDQYGREYPNFTEALTIFWPWITFSFRHHQNPTEVLGGEFANLLASYLKIRNHEPERTMARREFLIKLYKQFGVMYESADGTHRTPELTEMLIEKFGHQGFSFLWPNQQFEAIITGLEKQNRRKK